MPAVEIAWVSTVFNTTGPLVVSKSRGDEKCIPDLSSIPPAFAVLPFREMLFGKGENTLTVYR